LLEPIRSSRLYKRAARLLLALDAYVDSSLFDSSRGAREAYENFSAFMNRFQVRGLRRVAVEIGCESLTLALGGGLVALALSVSAMRMTSDDWLKKQDLSITFLIAMAPSPDSAASSMTTPCRSINIPITSSRLCWRPRIDASTSISA
jgi:penicillin-binding protein 1A